MASSVLRWVFHTPLRLLLVSLTVASVLVCGVTLAGSTPDPPGPPTTTVLDDRPAASRPRTASPPVVRTPAAEGPTPSERIRVEDRRTATHTARAFVHAWTSGRDGRISEDEWLDGIEPLTTAALFEGLRLTDPSELPDGRVDRISVQAMGAFSARLTVTLTSGLALDVDVVSEGDRWAVANIRPDSA